MKQKFTHKSPLIHLNGDFSHLENVNLLSKRDIPGGTKENVVASIEL